MQIFEKTWNVDSKLVHVVFQYLDPKNWKIYVDGIQELDSTIANKYRAKFETAYCHIVGKDTPRRILILGAATNNIVSLVSEVTVSRIDVIDPLSPFFNFYVHNRLDTIKMEDTVYWDVEFERFASSQLYDLVMIDLPDSLSNFDAAFSHRLHKFVKTGGYVIGYVPPGIENILSDKFFKEEKKYTTRNFFDAGEDLIVKVYRHGI